MIAESTIEKVRNLDIEDVLSKYLTIKKHEACCPFHNEKTPSFRVNVKRQYYKCFGCGESGDGIQFVQKHDRLTFTEAIEKLANDHNISIEYSTNDTPEQRKERMGELDLAKKILSWAHEYYRKQLAEHPEIKAHLLKRGFDDDKIEEWQLGYAPEGWKNITTTIINNGWYTVAHKIGLIQTKNENSYDSYRHRIIIPIYDKFGQIIGFGARAIGDEKPKYLNPNENFLYSKANVLYGLDRAAKSIVEKGRAVLVEGYFDVMAMHNAGFENVVAPCGTACDEKQLQLIKRYTTNISIMYDGDAAGQKAAEALVQKALKMGFMTYYIALDGMDPDEWMRSLTTDL